MPTIVFIARIGILTHAQQQCTKGKLPTQFPLPGNCLLCLNGWNSFMCMF